MRKYTVLLASLLLLLCACAKEEPAPQATAPAATEAVIETTVETTVPETETQAEAEADTRKEQAMALIEAPVEDLYAAIGYPESSDYAPSCLVEGGEDGNLYYDGFIVYTIRKGDQETVYYVE